MFDFESAKGRMAKILEKEVSIHLDNVPLETILLNLSQSGRQHRGGQVIARRSSRS